LKEGSNTETSNIHNGICLVLVDGWATLDIEEENEEKKK
jgi:hypothetical protein